MLLFIYLGPSIGTSAHLNSQPQSKLVAGNHLPASLDDNEGSKSGGYVGAYIPDLAPLLPVGSPNNKLQTVPFVTDNDDDDDGMDLASSPPTHSHMASSPRLITVTAPLVNNELSCIDDYSKANQHKPAQSVKKYADLFHTSRVLSSNRK